MHKNMKAWDVPDFCAFVFFYALVIYRKLGNDDFLKGGGIQHFMIFFVTKMIFFIMIASLIMIFLLSRTLDTRGVLLRGLCQIIFSLLLL